MAIFVHRAKADESISVSSVEELQRMIFSGEITPDDHVFWDESIGWKRLRCLTIVNGELAVAEGQSSSPPSPPPPHPRDLSTKGTHDHNVSLTVDTGNCMMAYVAFGLACLAFVVGAVTAIPAAICGHIATAQIKAQPGLRGQGWAKAALILAYIIITLNALVLLGLVAFFAAAKGS